MEVVQERVTIAAHRSNLSELREIMRKLCKQFGVRPNTTRRLVLAVDEATSNVIEHSGVEPGSRIEISLEVGEENVVAQIRDEGIEFDAAKNKKTLNPTTGPLRLKRGFGLYLIHLITDRIEYRRTEDGKNVLTLVIVSR